MNSVVRIMVNGEEYTLKVLTDGYGVCSTSNPANRFNRYYTVRANQEGRPIACSCLYCQYGDRWCKHLKAIEKWWYENTPQGRESLLSLQLDASRYGLR